MKKLKQFYNENRVFTILMGIVLFCILLMAFIILRYFVFSNGHSVYGDRLKDADKYEISDSLKEEVVSKLKEDESITDASVRVSVRTIYISIDFNSTISLDEAKGKAITALEQFGEDELGYYDVEFILSQESTDDTEGFIIMGAKNVNGTNIVWNNNTPVEDE